METIEPVITLITSLWDRVTHAPAHLLLMLVLNIIGAVLKRIPEVSNRVIPLWLMALGTLGYSLMASPGSVSPDVRNPWLVLAMFGFVLGFGAWMLHVFIFRKLGQHLPEWLKKEFDGTPLVLALLLPLLGAGCTFRTVTYPTSLGPVIYTHKSFGVRQSIGELRVRENDVEVSIKGYSNDQAEAIGVAVEKAVGAAIKGVKP